MMDENIFKKLNRHIHKADLIQSSRHCAAIVLDGKILSIGVNKQKTHPLQKKYQDKPERLFIHAEIDAISKVKDRKLLQGSSIYVTRLSKGGNIGNSRPCEGCLSAIKAFGIKGIYYT